MRLRFQGLRHTTLVLAALGLNFALVSCGGRVDGGGNPTDGTGSSSSPTPDQNGSGTQIVNTSPDTPVSAPSSGTGTSPGGVDAGLPCPVPTNAQEGTYCSLEGQGCVLFIDPFPPECARIPSEKENMPCTCRGHRWTCSHYAVACLIDSGPLFDQIPPDITVRPYDATFGQAE
jgi:hypothetical protein